MNEETLAPSRLIAHLESMQAVAAYIKRGLAGQPFQWNGTEGMYNVMWAERMGIHLVSETQIKKRGYRLKRGAKPVGSRYFGAPIQRQTSLYVLECQSVKVKK